jgi:sugar phosphate isomerase/epimerase
VNRREFLGSLPVAAALASVSPANAQSSGGQTQGGAKPGRIKHGATRQVFGANRPLEDCFRIGAEVGIRGFDFIANPADFALLRKYGLTGSLYRVSYGGGISGGRPPDGPPGWEAIGLKGEGTAPYLTALHEGIDVAAANGFPNVITMAGARSATLSYEQGMDNAVAFCNAVNAHAEDKNVTLCIEYLNSKGLQSPVNSLFDHMSWGVDVVKRVGSPRVKILYDIYHAQIMEGYIVQTLRDNIQYIGHIHTGGVPGRHELDETQELNYRFIAQTIAELKFTGFVTHEWSPAPGNDPIASIKKVLAIMDV